MIHDDFSTAWLLERVRAVAFRRRFFDLRFSRLNHRAASIGVSVKLTNMLTRIVPPS